MIEFESVGKTFRDGTAAVVDLSLTVPTGKITVIVGPSGCGKTTTLRMVNRMIEPTSGRITWDGAPLKSKRKTTLRRQMGYVIQSGGLFPHRTVLENIGTVPGLLKWSKPKTQKRSLELLAAVGLDRKLAHRYPAQLSGGQQQRVGVARALAADPLVMLMDEPFSAVDPVVRSELHEFFLGLQREISKTIILITHDIDEAVKLGDQVAILRVGGKLAQVGTPQEVLNEPADSFVEGFVGRDRGYRSLSFHPANTLELDRVKVVREIGAAPAHEPTLVVDADARPTGWVDASRPGALLPLGATFRYETDTLRAALDSALTSPFGLAVAVAADTGRFAGVVNAKTILSSVAESHTPREATTVDEAFRRPDAPGEDSSAGEVSVTAVAGDTAEASELAEASDKAVASEPALPTAEDVPAAEDAENDESSTDTVVVDRTEAEMPTVIGPVATSSTIPSEGDSTIETGTAPESEPLPEADPTEPPAAPDSGEPPREESDEPDATNRSGAHVVVPAGEDARR